MKIRILILLLLSSLLLTSCNSRQNVSTNNVKKELIDTVIKIEELDHKYSNFYLTSEEYLSGLNGMFADFFKNEMHFDRCYLPNPIKENLLNLSSQQVEQARKEVKKEGYNLDITVKVSNVYDNPEKNWKHLFTESSIINSKNQIINYSAKRYTFEKINEKWKIIIIDKASNGTDLIDNKPKKIF